MSQSIDSHCLHLTGDTLAVVARDGAAEPSTTGAPPGYELLSEIGRGGMGVVYLARDLRLHREVAVKVLHQRYPVDSATAQRFVEEALITGQLQHPAIPAVHQVGTLADGRPFLVMKLIKGQTLSNWMVNRTDDVAGHGRVLAIFEQVCQAVGYAHAHRVIHRDLKPANVMVGSFGEVQVMDWGVAKVLADDTGTNRQAPDTTLGTEIRSLREEGEYTRSGSVLGTPAYMSPEQAIGAIEQVDERTDVFSLGALLCALLTGEPPYRGNDSEEVRQLAARAKLEDAHSRLDGCGAEPDLVALAKRCLSPERTERPRDAAELAAAVGALRAEAEHRARRAELERVEAEVRATERRKRRRVKLGLTGSIAVLVVGTVVAFFIVQYQRDRRRSEVALAREITSIHESINHWTELKGQLNQIERWLTDSPDLMAKIDRDQVTLDKSARDKLRRAMVLEALTKAETAKPVPLQQDLDLALLMEINIRLMVAHRYAEFDRPAAGIPHLKRAIQIGEFLASFQSEAAKNFTSVMSGIVLKCRVRLLDLRERCGETEDMETELSALDSSLSGSAEHRDTRQALTGVRGAELGRRGEFAA
jgi:serine/threonine protein kinase